VSNNDEELIRDPSSELSGNAKTTNTDDEMDVETENELCRVSFTFLCVSGQPMFGLPGGIPASKNTLFKVLFQ
jgi:hypothetical protein